jgi:hypothetical protein
MARGKVVEFDYYEFSKLLRRASDSGARIAQQKFEGAVPVIIAEGKDTDGLYFHSKNEESCLKLVFG